MSIFKYLGIPSRKSAAKIARERLQIVLSHERREGGDADFLPKMRNELLTVISKYVKIDKDSNQCSIATHRKLFDSGVEYHTACY